MLSFGLKEYFDEIYSWDEIQGEWKDIRQIQADYLVDDSEYHKENAEKFCLGNQYIIVPVFGCQEDVNNPQLWIQKIEDVLL